MSPFQGKNKAEKLKVDMEEFSDLIHVMLILKLNALRMGHFTDKSLNFIFV